MPENALRDVPRDTPILVTGAGGFIGGWMMRDLEASGFTDVLGVDVKPIDRWFQTPQGIGTRQVDLHNLQAARSVVQGRQVIFNFAADMGGMGFIEANKAACMTSVLINTNLLLAMDKTSESRFFFASSACVYNQSKQSVTEVQALAEDDAYPANPEDGYGWEKLFSERMVRHYSEDFGIQGRVGRFHNVYGPLGSWNDGREKAPAAICRKVATAAITGNPEIEIWGDGEQTRSFTFIDDALEGVQRLTFSDCEEPLNIGSSEMVSINQLVDVVEQIAGVHLKRKHILDAPLGVRGRNSDNTRIRKVLDWEPSTPLATGLERTYEWVHSQVASETT